jgi:hypothetical protein
VEPDYLPDLEVFYFQPCLYPMKYLHPKVCTLFHVGECRGGVPPLRGPGGLSPQLGGLGASGGSGAKPPKKKLPCKSIL